MKHPSFQFYPSDWLRDTALRSCSMGARGLWMDMICYMHEGNPYGYLKVGDKVILNTNLARMVGETLEVVEGWLKELKEANVFDIDDGAICSRRMIRDENLRKIRAAGGAKGGNPALMDKDKVNHEDNQEVNFEDKQNPTPSSSSSSSSSSSFSNIKEGKPSLSGTSFPPCPHTELLKLWGKHLSHLTQPRTWEGNRQANMRQRWIQAGKPSAYSPEGYKTTEEGLKWWDSFFGYIANDTSLANGFETKGRTWRPDLEWVVNATNFQKIIDGKYAK